MAIFNPKIYLAIFLSVNLVLIAFSFRYVNRRINMAALTYQESSRSNGQQFSYTVTPKDVVKCFPARQFHPPRGVWGFLKKNEHWQTIVGSEALRLKLVGAIPRTFQTARERFTTPDGDFFDVDFTPNLTASQGVVVLLHGLESNSHGPLITKMATAFIDKGFGCALVSFRGCSGEDNNTPGAYHMGFTTDAKQVIEVLHSRYPHLPLYLSGFSLGGNVVLKCAGELGGDAQKYNVRGCIATCVPFDLVACQGKIDKGFNRAVYSENFLATLKRKAERQHARFPGAFDLQKVLQCRTIGDFDDAYIAPIYNFKDKIDYYEKTASRWYLRHIRVPTVAINAIDDPFIEASSLPSEEDVGDAPVRLIYHKHGGHCGFVADQESYRDEGVDKDSEVVVPQHGWLAEEMSRALWHIHANVST